jgi:hypothetical protein
VSAGAAEWLRARVEGRGLVQRTPIDPGYGAIVEAAAVQRREAKPASAPPATESDPSAVSVADARVTVDAIIDIINEYVEEDPATGMVRQTQYPSAHPEVPAQYRPLLQEWYLVTHGSSRQGSLVISIPGAMLGQHLDMALKSTQPLLDVLAGQGDAKATESRLATELHARVAELRRKAIASEVTESIEKGATGPGARLPDLDLMSHEEKLKIGASEALKAIRTTNTVVNRLLSGAAGDLAKRAQQLQVEFEKVAAQATGDNAALPPEVAKMNVAGALVFLKGGLDGVNAILSVADPNKRAKLFASHRTFFGKAAGASQLLIVLGQFIHGAVAVTGAAVYSVASVMGKSAVATQVLAKGLPALGNINFALNAVGVVHGFAVLLDSEASSEEKTSAILEVGVSGAGVLGRFIAGFSVPATASVLINFYSVKAILEKGAEGYGNLMRLGLNICFADMRREAEFVRWTALRLAIAGEQALHETNPDRKAELDRMTKSYQWNLVDFGASAGGSGLREYLRRATTRYGAGNQDPAAYGPTLIDRFQPLVGRKMETPEQALSVAAELLQIIARCFAEPEKILHDAALWAWKENG